MGKPYSLDFRQRVVGHVAAGRSCRAVGRVFGVSPSTAVRIVSEHRSCWDVSPKPQGRPAGRCGKLAPHMDLPTEIVRAEPDITLAELGNALEDTFDLHSRRSIAHCSEPGSHIKGLIAKERDRSALRRERGINNRRQPRMRLELHRPVFIDETAVKTDLTRLRGRAPVGESRTLWQVGHTNIHRRTDPRCAGRAPGDRRRDERERRAAPEFTNVYRSPSIIRRAPVSLNLHLYKEF